jgi:hypothetical protein
MKKKESGIRSKGMELNCAHRYRVQYSEEGGERETRTNTKGK